MPRSRHVPQHALGPCSPPPPPQFFFPILTRAADLFEYGDHLKSANAGSVLCLCLAQPGLSSCSSTSHSGLQCRQRHADVLEWLWFLQTHAEHLEGNMHGDKDMNQLAFALANKSEEYTQVGCNRPAVCATFVCMTNRSTWQSCVRMVQTITVVPICGDTSMSCYSS